MPNPKARFEYLAEIPATKEALEEFLECEIKSRKPIMVFKNPDNRTENQWVMLSCLLNAFKAHAQSSKKGWDFSCDYCWAFIVEELEPYFKNPKKTEAKQRAA